jgi:hypothetical protein
MGTSRFNFSPFFISCTGPFPTIDLVSGCHRHWTWGHRSHSHARALFAAVRLTFS